MKHRSIHAVAAAAALALSLTVSAARAQGEPAAAASAAAPASEMTDGEIRKIDKANGKLTIKHGEIKNLDMPGMTMVFRVNDPALIDKVNAGDKVRFKAMSDGGKVTVTEIDVVK